MANKFAIFNPAEGAYVYADTPDQAVQLLAQTALNFYELHSHGRLFSFVQVNEDGTERWFTESGDPTPSTQEIEAALAEEMARRTDNRIYGSLPVTQL